MFSCNASWLRSMLHCAVLHCAVLHCAVLCCAVLCCAVLCCAALHDVSCAVCTCLLPQPVLPSWTFQPSALQELWAHDPDEESDLDWSQHTPQLSPSLVPLVDGELQQLADTQHAVRPCLLRVWAQREKCSWP
jgi:hypothetical protein